jgi:thiol-disulfide isomerase/thioredoxin
MLRTVIIVVCALALVSAAGIALTKRLTGSYLPPTASRASTGPPVALTPGKGVKIDFSDHPLPLPAFALTDLDGRPLSSEIGRGKVVLVNFWATWCGPCVEEIPTLIALQEYYKDQLQIIGLSLDTKPVEEVRQFASTFGLNYPVAIATGELVEAFGGVPAVPATFIVTPAGQIIQRRLGLLDPRRTEHEVRSLANLSTEADVAYVKDTGQVLLANAAYATEVPGVDLAGLTPAQKELALKRLNAEHCNCGCGLTLAQCRINDPSCAISPDLARQVVSDIRK